MITFWVSPDRYREFAVFQGLLVFVFRGRTMPVSSPVPRTAPLHRLLLLVFREVEDLFSRMENAFPRPVVNGNPLIGQRFKHLPLEGLQVCGLRLSLRRTIAAVAIASARSSL